MVGDQVALQAGDFVKLQKGTTEVSGQCMGFKINQEGVAQELWIDGFYVPFELGDNENEWRFLNEI